MNILHDIHTHNLFSNCCTDYTASTAAFLQKEAALGNRVFGLSNHVWDERVPGASGWYRTQSIARCEEARASLAHAPDGMRVLFGGETEYYACRDLLGMSPEGASHFDYLLFPHSHIHMRNEVMSDYPEILEARAQVRAELAERLPNLSEAQVTKMAAQLKEADLIRLVPEMKTDIHRFVANAMVDSFRALLAHPDFQRIAGQLPVAIAHCFAPCGFPHAEKNSILALLDDAALRDCFSSAAALGVFIEINTGAVSEVGTDLSKNEMIRIFRIAKSCGCRFTFGSDSHSVKGLENIRFGDLIASALALSPSDIAGFLQDGVER